MNRIHPYRGALSPVVPRRSDAQATNPVARPPSTSSSRTKTKLFWARRCLATSANTNDSLRARTESNLRTSRAPELVSPRTPSNACALEVVRASLFRERAEDVETKAVAHSLRKKQAIPSSTLLRAPSVALALFDWRLESPTKRMRPPRPAPLRTPAKGPRRLADQGAFHRRTLDSTQQGFPCLAERPRRWDRHPGEETVAVQSARRFSCGLRARLP